MIAWQKTRSQSSDQIAITSLLLIEHINLNVGDAAVAMFFYCDCRNKAL
jgi:hypothetical protein